MKEFISGQYLKSNLANSKMQDALTKLHHCSAICIKSTASNAIAIAIMWHQINQQKWMFHFTARWHFYWNCQHSHLMAGTQRAFAIVKYVANKQTGEREREKCGNHFVCAWKWWIRANQILFQHEANAIERDLHKRWENTHISTNWNWNTHFWHVSKQLSNKVEKKANSVAIHLPVFSLKFNFHVTWDRMDKKLCLKLCA